ncbi:MAG TPA: DUF3052 domain-containing protein [Gemmatimonadaceae bacterium]|nr:DUF3052 domain-containing protein [Gemmatimonadaceae bacterium]
MSSSGYSGTPLAKKLGIKEGTTVVTVAAPKGYAKLLEPLPLGVKITSRASPAPAFVHVFATERRALESTLQRLRKSLAQDGMVWVSWPKQSSGVATDITEDVIREVALPLQFVDVKVCAVDETWSGLKVVIRREARRVDAAKR